jgi:hypothetical protein
LTFALANGVRYTPDYVGWLGERLTAWEVKGPQAWDDSLVKLKVAARAWPRVDFWLAWRVKGVWKLQKIIP